MSSAGGAGGKRTVADVLMWNARDAARKAKKATAGASGAPSPKKPRTQPAAQADDAGVEPEVAEKPPSLVKSKRSSSPVKSKSKADPAPGEEKRSLSPTRSKTLASPAQLEAKENSPSPKKSKTLAAKSDAKPSDEGVVSQSDEKKKRRSLSPTKAKGQASQSDDKKRPSSPKKTKASDAPKSEEKNTALELKKKGSEFDPMAAAYWKPGEPVPFLFLARALDLISNESGRIIITEILSNVFRTVIATTPEDLLATVYLSANRIAPPHEGIELGIGDASIIRALSEAYGRKEEHVKKNLKELGDLGLVAKASRSSQKMMYKPKPLTIARVLTTFRTIAKESGKDSQDKKRSHIKGLLVAATDCEPQYIIRLLQSKMRIGLAEKTIQMALGQAAVYSQKNSWPPKVQSPFEELRRQALASLHSGLPNSQGIPISHVVEWLAMEEILSEVEFLRMILPFGKRVFLSNERVWTESTRRLICLITQNEPNVRNVLLTELSIVAGENLQAHLQVVILINEGRDHREQWSQPGENIPRTKRMQWRWRS